MNILIPLILIWGLEWIYYSWRKPFKTFLNIGYLTAMPTLIYCSFNAIIFLIIMSTINFFYIVTERNIILPKYFGTYLGFTFGAFIVFCLVGMIKLLFYYRNELKVLK